MKSPASLPADYRAWRRALGAPGETQVAVRSTGQMEPSGPAWAWRGLVVHPKSIHPDWMSDPPIRSWTVSHQMSGLCLIPGLHRGQAMGAMYWMAGAIDWTRVAAALRADPDARRLRDEVRERFGVPSWAS